MNQQTIVFERLFNAPVARVWKAITDKQEMKAWYFDLAEFRAEPGFQFQFLGGPAPDRQYLHLCEITEVVPEKRLSYSWRYDGFQGNTLVTFELFAQKDKTLLRLTHTGLETLAGEHPDFAGSNFIEGWNYLLNTSLKRHLEPSEKPDYQNHIMVNVSAAAVFDSLVRRIPEWWTAGFEGSAQQRQDVFTIRFGNTVKTLEVEEMMPNKKIVWKVLEAFIDAPELGNKSEWVGTRIIWDIIPQPNWTVLSLTHQGFTKDFECYTICEEGWKFYLKESLYGLLTLNKGVPSPGA